MSDGVRPLEQGLQRVLRTAAGYRPVRPTYSPDAVARRFSWTPQSAGTSGGFSLGQVTAPTSGSRGGGFRSIHGQHLGYRPASTFSQPANFPQLMELPGLDLVVPVGGSTPEPKVSFRGFGSQMAEYRRILQPPKLGVHADMLEQLQQQYDTQSQLLANALAMNAQMATFSINNRLEDLQLQINEVQTLMDGAQPAWDQWRNDVDAVLADTAEAAVAAYNQYAALVAQGYDQWTAATISRFRDYQNELKEALGEYMDATNEGYDDVMSRLPAHWQKAIDATLRADQDALQAIKGETYRAEKTVLAQARKASKRFDEIMTNIDADNPALADELLGDMERGTTRALAAIQAGADGRAAIQEAAGLAARKAMDYSLKATLRTLEDSRTDAIRIAELETNSLLKASDSELESLLESAAVSRQQALLNISASLQQLLANIETQRQQAELDYQYGLAAMEFDLETTMEGLLRDFARGQQELSFENYQLDMTAYQQWLEQWQGFEKNEAEFAASFMTFRLEELGLDAYDQTLIEQNILDFWAGSGGWYEHDQGATKIRSVAEFDAYIDGIRLRNASIEAANADLAPGMEPSELLPIPSDDILDAYRAGFTAYRSGVDQHGAYQEWWESIGPPPNPLLQAWMGSGATFQSFAHPLPGTASPTPFGSFGAQRDDGARVHMGSDFNAPTGTPIHAFTGGTIIESGWLGNLAGFGVRVQTDEGWIMSYAHMNLHPSTYGIATGQRVGTGSVIGQVGSTGNSQVPHLHFSMHLNGQYVDPMMFLGGLYNG